MKTVLYIHGKGGNASESTHYENLFPDCKVTGLDYKTFSPWETGKEIHDAVAHIIEKNAPSGSSPRKLLESLLKKRRNLMETIRNYLANLVQL